MPRYRAKETGFWDGRLYGPKHPRRKIVHSDKKLDPVPKWLELMEDEKPQEAAQRKRRESAKARADAAKKKQDDKEISFVTGPSAAANTVETL